MARKNTKSFKIQVSVDRYTAHVLENLIEIKGTSIADVANFILKDWIGDHFNELEKYKITVEKSSGKLILDA
ncbi:MAG: hypothetical protein KJ808_03635 [Acidobacteria bacterium]|nr:hypothetical protein [Acidobacteriota bacterium]MBU4307567.1 hypothetical protein [Acidobacteriota bacterium]MCG2811070.1 hypothetical protein [Candidatus Aminicenantes bacterium]